MGELYRKAGRVVRVEDDYVIRSVESGQAIEEGESFTCEPDGRSVTIPEIDPRGVQQIAEWIRAAVALPLSIERLIVSEGLAQHQFGDRRWFETSMRSHIALTNGRLRALFDFGEFNRDEFRRAAHYFARAGEERDAPPHVRLAPPVAAALLPALVGIAPPNTTLVQTSGGIDGKGEAIEVASADARPWPNWFRPSYRARPVRAPMNLQLRCDIGAIDPVLPEAVAILEPVTSLTLRVLCVDAGMVYPATFHIARIEAVADETRWYPYGAGSLGAEMLVATSRV